MDGRVQFVFLVPAEDRRGHHFPGTRVINHWEQPSGRRKKNPGPLEESPVFLISEPFIEPPSLYYYLCDNPHETIQLLSIF